MHAPIDSQQDIAMDDQFGGRTDDDLFYDDFEPVSLAAADATTVDSLPPTLPAALEDRVSNQSLSTSVSAHEHPSTTSTHRRPPQGNHLTARQTSSPGASRDGQASILPAPPLPTSFSRLQSGANPRTKLTEAELSAKLEKMRIQSAQMERKFQQATQDEKRHAEACAEGLEQALKRRAQEESRRRQRQEETRRRDHDRKLMEDERARNRERKLRALEAKDGNWDAGKADDPSERPIFRAVNGGVRGAVAGGALSASIHAQAVIDPAFLRGRGRDGRSGRAGGRGCGRVVDGAQKRDAQSTEPGNHHAVAGGAARNAYSAPSTQILPLKPDDFPVLPTTQVDPIQPPITVKVVALPAKQVSNIVAAAAAAPSLDLRERTSKLSAPPIKWNDEMDAVDAASKGAEYEFW